MNGDIGRRDLIKLTAGAALAAQGRASGQPAFFTPAEYQLVDELTEIILPADEKSGGAKAARVTDYIDARLAEAFEPSERDHWRKGLALVDSLAHEMHGAPFLKCSAAQRVSVLNRMAANEKNPAKPEEYFFVDLKSETVRGYYTSRIGIHDDMDYKGNTLQQREYAGYLPDAAKGK